MGFSHGQNPWVWDPLPGKNTRVGSHFLLQGSILTQWSNPHLLCLLYWQMGSLPRVLYHPGSPKAEVPKLICICIFFCCVCVFFFPFILISWRLITLQYCSGFCHTLTWISHGFTCVPHPDSPLPPPSPSHPSGSSQCTSPEHLSHASNLGWWSVSPLIVYLFQCYSLRTSHPRLLPQSPKVCSVHLSLFSVLHIGLSLPSF